MRVLAIKKRKSSMVDKDLQSDKDSVHKIAATKKEENVSVNCKTYTDYIFFSKINYFLFPLSIFFFFFT